MIFVYGLYNNGTTFADEFVRDLLVTSHIEASEALRLYEFWYEFGEGPWSGRTGRPFRNDLRQSGREPAHETAWELTYARPGQ